MKVLIDGHNALEVLRIRGADHAEQRRLVLLMARERDPDATVFFDARGAPPGVPRKFREEGVRVVYCHQREADEEIVEAVNDAGRPDRLLVVTDDRGLAGRARQLGARSTSVATFFAPRKREPAPSSEEVKPQGTGGFTAADFDLPDEIDLDAPPSGD